MPGVVTRSSKLRSFAARGLDSLLDFELASLQALARNLEAATLRDLLADGRRRGAGRLPPNGG
ncbi:MAG: hypothetical protein KC636_27870 [Myxococcales bacterium]|nr:hypothetical protein [Myxococcales bacterium]